MNATVRWVNAFLENIECVSCRTQDNLGLYDPKGNAVDLDKLVESELHSFMLCCEVWCDKCKRTPTLKSRSAARTEHKKEASYLADLAVRNTTSSREDIHVLEGREVTRKKLIETLLHKHVCFNCGGSADLLVSFLKSRYYDKGRRLSVVANFSGFSFDQFLKELDNSTVLCYSCFNDQNFDRKALPTVVLDTEFWSLYDQTNQF